MPSAQSKIDGERFRLETERLRALVCNIRLGVLVEDQERQVVMVNDAFAELFGIPAADIVGTDCARAAVAVAPRFTDPEQYLACLAERIEGGVSAVADEVTFRGGRVLERDYVPIVVDSVRCGHLWLFRDVTESRRLVSLERAAAVRDELRVVIDTIPGLVWSALPSGRVELFNQRWREYTGLALGEGSSWGWDAILWPEDLAAFEASFSTALIAGRPAEAEARLRRADGQYRWFLFRAVPLLGSDGFPTRWYGQAIDIDDRKHSEEALLRAQMELSHVSRVTTLGELAASIVHEVSQPLTAMVTNARTCLKLVSGAEQNIELVRDSLTAIRNSGARAGEVLGRIRALLARAPIEHQRCSIDQVLRSAVSLARSELTLRGVQLELSLGESHVEITGDPVELQQVVLNLLLNAGEATRDLDASRRRVLVTAHIAQEGDAPSVTVSVRDHGVGIDEAEMGRVFSAFYTTKPSGLGMGLSISRSIIERHGGRLWASRNADHGATLAFSLPVACLRPRSEVARSETPG